MQSTAPLRVSPASSKFFQLCHAVLQRRGAATYRRSRSKLNIKPDPVMVPSRTEAHDHIIFSPPPSQPNVYHTPTIFLPKDDKRRELQIAMAPPQAIGGPPLLTEALPPAVRKPYEKRYHLTTEQIKEMRSLREVDPTEWTRSRLAKKFDCSNVFVSFVTEGLAKEKWKQQRQVTDVVKSNWGVRRRTAREDRQLRKERWFRDA